MSADTHRVGRVRESSDPGREPRLGTPRERQPSPADGTPHVSIPELARRAASVLRLDTRFTYRGPTGRPARCRLRIFEHEGAGLVLLATDLGNENPGASVTNGIEQLVAAACRAYRLDPSRLTVVEHYDDRGTPAAVSFGREHGESFDIVTFEGSPREGSGGAIWAADAFAGPRWRRISKHEAEDLIGQPLG